jgi:hypothetical protein
MLAEPLPTLKPAISVSSLQKMREELQESVRVLNKYAVRRWGREVDLQIEEDFPRELCVQREDLRQSIPGLGTRDDIEAARFMPLSDAVETLREMMSPQSSIGIPAKSMGEEQHPYRFERDGDVWRLQFDKERDTLKHRKGLKAIALLFEKPDKSIDALDLEGIGLAHAPRRQGDSDVLTKEVKEHYMEQIREINAQMEIARRRSRDKEYGELEKEKTAILKQLKAAAGITGKSKKLQAGNAAVAAHDRVEKAIKSARQRIAKNMPKLALHIQASIKPEGVSFAYHPGKASPDWKISY